MVFAECERRANIGTVRLLLAAMVYLATGTALAAEESAACSQYKSFSRVSQSAVLQALVERVGPRDALIDNGVVHAKVIVRVF